MIVNRNITLVCVENANYTIIVGMGFFVLLCKPLLLKFAVSQCFQFQLLLFLNFPPLSLSSVVVSSLFRVNLCHVFLATSKLKIQVHPP